MLENWCWDAGALARMSKHYKTGEPIPPALVKSPHDLTPIRAASSKDPSALYPAEQVEKIIASKNANAGFFNKRQLVFGLFDQVDPDSFTPFRPFRRSG